MEFYRLKEKEAKKEYYRTLIESIIVMVPLIAVISLIVEIKESNKMIHHRSWTALIIAFIVLLFFELHFSGRIKDALKSYIIIKDGNSIIRRTSGMPETMIGKSEISQVIIDLSRGMVIKGGHRTQIFIPKSLERYNEIRDMIISCTSVNKIAYKRIYWVWHFI